MLCEIEPWPDAPSYSYNDSPEERGFLKYSSAPLVENTEIAGYYYYILKMIAWEGINIVEILSTTNEFSIILADSDVDRAFSTIQRARKQV